MLSEREGFGGGFGDAGEWASADMDGGGDGDVMAGDGL